MQIRQTPENRNMLPWNSSVSIKSGRNFVVVNARNHINVIQNDIPKFFNCSGITSEMIKNGSGKMAHDAIKMAKPNEASGMKLNDSTE